MVADRSDETSVLRARLERRERELAAARRVSEAFSSLTGVDEVIAVSLELALDAVGARSGSVLLADPASRRLVFRHSVGESPVPAGTSIEWTRGIAGAVFHCGEPRVVQDAALDAEHCRDIDALTGYATANLFALPLRLRGGQTIGVLEVLNKAGATPEADDLDVLCIIAAFAAGAIEQARLHEERRMAEIARRVGDIGHDIKNMLSPVLFGVGLLQSAARSGQMTLREPRHWDLSDLLSTMRHSVRRVQSRVKLVADCVSGLSTPPRREECRLQKIVEGVFETLRLVARERGVSLEAAGLGTAPPIEGDRIRLYNAIYNLVDNAMTATGPGGSVLVRVEPEGDGVRLEVADTGRGMSPSVRDSLFTGHSSSSKPGGSGLGTRIVRDVVEEHGGRVSLESELGKGSRVAMWLPGRLPTALRAHFAEPASQGEGGSEGGL